MKLGGQKKSDTARILKEILRGIKCKNWVVGHVLKNLSFKGSNFLHDGRMQQEASFKYGTRFGKLNGNF